MGALRPFTLINPFYENQGMLLEQLRVWRSLPDKIRTNLHVIVVDDCSPCHPALPMIEPTGVGSFRLYRTLEDRRWNWLFARNLGVHVAQTDWVLMTDIDHVVPARTWTNLMTEKLDPQAVYRFSRVDAPDLTPYKPHPNSWCLTRAMFDRIGGYDERFSGYYGSDSEFRERVHKACNQRVILRNDVLIRYPREVIPDASTTTYGRKERQDGEGVARVRAERAEIRKWKPLRLTFPWERLI